MRLTKEFTVLVEDDNGRYFHITLEARDSNEAKTRTAYILNNESARILQVAVA